MGFVTCIWSGGKVGRKWGQRDLGSCGKWGRKKKKVDHEDSAWPHNGL